jgi:hypothetical protein
VNPDADARQFGLLFTLVQGGIGLLEGSALVAEESGDPAWKEAVRRLQKGAPFVECVPRLPPTLTPIVRWGERSGRLEESLRHVKDFWTRPLDPRVPFFFLTRATEDLSLRQALQEAREFSGIHPEWSTLAAAENSAEQVRSCTALFPAPLSEAVSAAVTDRLLPKVFAALGRGCDSDLIPVDARTDRASSIRYGLYSLSLLMTVGRSIGAALASTCPTIRHGATHREFSALQADTLGDAPMPFLSPSANALIRRAARAGQLPETLEYVATHLVGG